MQCGGALGASRNGSSSCHVSPEDGVPIAAQAGAARCQQAGASFQRQKLPGELNDAIKGEERLLLLRFLF